MLAFGALYVASRWDDLRAALERARPWWIVAAVAFASAGQWCAGQGFRAVLAATSKRLPVVDTARVYFVSQLGKYLPGSVWPVVAVSQMCRRYGITREAAAAAGVISLLFSLATGGMVGIALVLAGATGGGAGLWWLVLLVPVGVLAVHPRVIVPATNAATRVLRQPRVEIDLGRRSMRPALGWPAASWILLGLQCWALAVSLGAGELRSIVPAVGGFALAYVAGVLFVPAPAGAGVREAVLTVALSGTIHSTAGFTRSSVVVVVLLSRVLLAFLDFGQAGFTILLGRRWGRRVEAG